ncbi:TIR domain [Mactra antiquata]
MQALDEFSLFSRGNTHIRPPLPDEITFHWYVVAGSVSVVIVTITMMFLLAYIMWRRRLVFMLKIVHYFQQYEEDDGKEFDAFISYKSCPRDENFVLHQLYPKLETEFKFKLCMHFRDFLPGEAIANNIVKAIESSRRTIIVLSPEYVKSEWCRMEYQKAQHEMLKLKHKIIPVVLEDISEVNNIDKNLKSIISSVTYLEWPGSDNSKKVEKFWKKLELSLPKKSTPSTISSSSSESISFSHPASDSNISSSETLTSSSMSQSTSRSVVRSATDSPTLSSVTTSSNSPKFLKNKRKDFRHFMGKLVRTKIFGRQDSNSSQAALVDEETIGSRSICGSVSESMLSESSESLCSSSDIPSKYLDEIREDRVNNTFIKACANERHKFDNGRRASLRKPHVSMDVIDKENTVINECEKDHCEDIECETCSKNRHVRNIPDSVDECFETTQTSTMNDIECDYCDYMRNKSDNNRVQISAVDGFQQLKIQKLPYTLTNCPCCNQLLERSVPYRGSMKERKDAKNFKIMNEKRRRVGSLPRNYKNSKIHAKQDESVNKESKTKACNNNGANSDESTIAYVNEGYIVDVCEEL